MTQVGRTEFKSDTSSLYPDNTAGEISPADLRAQMDNAADSATFKGTSKTTAPIANDDDVGTNGSGTFDEGDIWIDETNDDAYICADATTGAAVWLVLGGALTVTKSGTPAVTEVTLWLNDGEVIGDSEFTYASGALTITSGTPVLELAESGAAADNQRWRITTTSEEMLIQTLTDGGAAGSSFIAITRTGDLLNAFEMYESATLRTSLTQNALNFTGGGGSSITTTDATALAFEINSVERLILPSATQDLIISGNSGDGTAITSLLVGNVELTTGQARIAIGDTRAGLGPSHLDLITDNTTYTIYGFRTIRSAAVNATTQMLHRGTGGLSIITEEAASITLSTTNTARLTVASGGNIGIGTATPTLGLLELEAESPNIILLDTSSGLISEVVSGDTTLDIIVDAAAGVGSSAVTFNVDGTEMGRFESSGFTATKKINAQSGTSYTLVLADDSARITMDNGAGILLTIPLNSAVAFPIGTEIRIIQLGAGAVSIEGATSVTLNTVSDGTGAMAGAGEYTDILKVATDEWWAVGDIGAVS